MARRAVAAPPILPQLDVGAVQERTLRVPQARLRDHDAHRLPRGGGSSPPSRPPARTGTLAGPAGPAPPPPARGAPDPAPFPAPRPAAGPPATPRPPRALHDSTAATVAAGSSPHSRWTWWRVTSS